MSFDKLIAKVQQAEDSLEAQERKVSADFRQLKSSWRAAWTPGRIVIAGLVSGFLVGRAEPFKRAAGGGALQLITALSSLFASGHAQEAAEEADHAADAAQATATVAVGEVAMGDASVPGAVEEETGFRRDGPRVPEARPAGPTPAEAATEVSEHRYP
jgi:hypothetical protein